MTSIKGTSQQRAQLKSNVWDEIVRRIVRCNDSDSDILLPKYILICKEAISSFERLASTAVGAHNHRTGFVVFCNDKISFKITKEMPGSKWFKRIVTTGRIRHEGSYYNPTTE